MFGVPNEKWVETPFAAVILRQPGTVTAEELCQWIYERVDSKNQRVHGVTIFGGFPTRYRRETLKSILREPYWTGRDEKI
jgi:long-chain acyl-CoA synthetase